ncbi:MAG: cobalt-precorrin-5B (C(1))-methyltransferase CbiD [Bacillota bacterium]
MDELSYVIRNGKKLRKGYTTGSTAAAAARAATLVLFKKKKISSVQIDTPANIKLTLSVEEIKYNQNMVKAGIRKDGGDDPDITDGIMIYAEVREIKKDFDNQKRIVIKGGKGVGKITRTGLPVPEGEPAINPVPRKMIRKEVNNVLPDSKKVMVIIEIPQGEELAQKTLNPEVGIKGGLSILGTTGIVEPMSHKAYKDSIKIKLNQVIENDPDKVVLVFGNYGFKKAQALGYPSSIIVKMSNYVGFMLDRCLEKEINQVVIIGHLGKLVKVAGGIFNTHSKIADCRMEILAAYTASFGVDKKLVNNILQAATTEQAYTLIKEAGYNRVFRKLAERIQERCRKYVKKQLEIKVIIFTFNSSGILAGQGLENEVISDE